MIRSRMWEPRTLKAVVFTLCFHTVLQASARQYNVMLSGCHRTAQSPTTCPEHLSQRAWIWGPYRGRQGCLNPLLFPFKDLFFTLSGAGRLKPSPSTHTLELRFFGPDAWQWEGIGQPVSLCGCCPHMLCSDQGGQVHRLRVKTNAV